MYVWAPFMGASATPPSFPNRPNVPDLPNGAGSRPSDSADTGVSGAAFAAFRIEKSKWLVEASGLWADLDANRDDPKVKIGLNVVFAKRREGLKWRPA